MNEQVENTSMKFQLALLDFNGTPADSFPFFRSVLNRIADQQGYVDSLRHDGSRRMARHEKILR
jgi:beta-phosphoglucomutase-like phosphatase (HAD superfamily)